MRAVGKSGVHDPYFETVIQQTELLGKEWEEQEEWDRNASSLVLQQDPRRTCSSRFCPCCF
jgi:hypothetical protein